MKSLEILGELNTAMACDLCTESGWKPCKWHAIFTPSFWRRQKPVSDLYCHLGSLSQASTRTFSSSQEGHGPSSPQLTVKQLGFERAGRDSGQIRNREPRARGQWPRGQRGLSGDKRAQICGGRPLRFAFALHAPPYAALLC